MTALKKPVPFGKYYLLERINVGGMAEVFKAKAFGVEGFERLVAVKRILPNIAEDEEFITMFIDEAKIAVQLKHANIAQIFDLGKVDDSLLHRARVRPRQGPARDLRPHAQQAASRCRSRMACYVIMKVCEGLDYAHNKRDAQGPRAAPRPPRRLAAERPHRLRGRGQAHRLRHRQGGGQGVARRRPASSRASSATCRPSRCAACRSIGAATSSRSASCSTSCSPASGCSSARATSRRSRRSATSRSCRRRRTTGRSREELERIVLKALARDPEDRYQNAIDLHDDLQSFLYSVGEFYSRKDLAAWMKKTFAMEIEEDNAKLEEFRQVAPPVAQRRGVAPRGGRRPAGRPGGAGAERAAAKGGRAAKAAAQAASQAGAPATRRWGGTTKSWTRRSSTRKRSSRSRPRTCSSRTTTARSPTSRAPDILEQARPPGAADAEAGRR